MTKTKLTKLSLIIISLFFTLFLVEITRANPLTDGDKKDEEEIKIVIDDYFHSQYEAFSRLEPPRYDRLVDDSSEGKEFLKREKDKLKFQMHHARKYHLRYVTYEYFLDFQEISIDNLGKTADVSLLEGRDVLYEITQEISPSDPFLSQFRNIGHQISLRKKQETWVIVNDEYDDPFWRTIKNSGKSANELISLLDQDLNEEQQGMEVSPQAVLPPDSTSHPYNREAAVAYARTWWYHERNPAYYSFSGNDCQNFVSQAIHEGGDAEGVVHNPAANPDFGMDGWFWYDDTYYGAAWTNVGRFYDFTVGSYLVFQYGPEGTSGNLPKTNDVPPDVQLGDVIQYQWKGIIEEEWDHSALVVEKVGNVAYVSSHTPDVYKVVWTALKTIDDINLARYIHIDRIDGLSVRHIPLAIKNVQQTSSASLDGQTQVPYPGPTDSVPEFTSNPVDPYPGP